MFTLSEAAPCWRSTTRALPSYRGASCPPRRNVPGTPVAYRSPREQSRAVRPSDGVDNRSPSSPPPSPGVTDDGGHLGGGGTGVRHRRPAARGSDPSAQVLQRRLPSRRARGLCPGGCRRRPATATPPDGMAAYRRGAVCCPLGNRLGLCNSRLPDASRNAATRCGGGAPRTELGSCGRFARPVDPALPRRSAAISALEVGLVALSRLWSSLRAWNDRNRDPSHHRAQDPHRLERRPHRSRQGDFLPVVCHCASSFLHRAPGELAVLARSPGGELSPLDR